MSPYGHEERLRMCMGIPGRIVEISADQPHLATVETRGVSRLVNIGIIAEDGPRPGDWVDVHLGMAVTIVDEATALETLAFVEALESGELPSTR